MPRIVDLFILTSLIGAIGMQAAAQECDRSQPPSFELSNVRHPLYPESADLGLRDTGGTSMNIGPKLRLNLQNDATLYPGTRLEERTEGYRLSYTFDSRATMSFGKWQSRKRGPDDPGSNLPRKDSQVWYGIGGTIPF